MLRTLCEINLIWGQDLIKNLIKNASFMVISTFLSIEIDIFFSCPLLMLQRIWSFNLLSLFVTYKWLLNVFLKYSSNRVSQTPPFVERLLKNSLRNSPNNFVSLIYYFHSLNSPSFIQKHFKQITIISLVSHSYHWMPFVCSKWKTILIILLLLTFHPLHEIIYKW